LDVSQAIPRAHPWTVTSYDHEGGAYYDFIEHPELIPEVLEDFAPFEGETAVGVFYAFLAWLNGSDSLLETNDCALNPPLAEADMFRASLRIGGRVDIFYRDHRLNLVARSDAFGWLVRMFGLYLQTYRSDFSRGVITLGIRETHYVQLSETECVGYRLSVNFHAYGDTEKEVWSNLTVVFEGIWEAAKRVCLAVEAPMPEFP
ncbi:MAG: hypothetical protein ABI882_19380, partial [Acidobacteriota bacterium]